MQSIHIENATPVEIDDEAFQWKDSHRMKKKNNKHKPQVSTGRESGRDNVPILGHGPINGAAWPSLPLPPPPPVNLVNAKEMHVSNHFQSTKIF